MANKIKLRDTTTLSENTNPIPGYKFVGYDNSLLSEKLSNGNVNVIGELGIGNTLFVSNQGKTLVDGAQRESLKNHFSSLDEAIITAKDNDTIIIYGGTHSVTENLCKDKVIIQCLGKPVISSKTTLFDDNEYFKKGIPSTFKFLGDAIIQNGTQSICSFGISSVELEFDTITTTSNNPFVIKNTIGTININKLSITSDSNGVIFQGKGTHVVFNANLIEHDATNVSSEFGTIYVQSDSSSGNFTGDVKINIGKITSNGGRGGMIRIGNNDGTYTFDGKVNINIDEMEFTTSDTGNSSAFGMAAKIGTSFEVTLNSKLINTNRKGIHIFGNSNGVFNHFGKIISTSTDIEQSLVSNQGVSYPSNATINLKGEYINNGDVRDVIRVDGGTGNTLDLDGVKIYNNHDDVSETQTGIRISSDVSLLLNDVKIYCIDSVGSPVSISTNAATNIKVLQSQASTNVSADVNITNTITGTSLIVDADII